MRATATSQAWGDVALLDLVTIKSGQVDPREAAYRGLPLIAPDHIASGTGRLIKRESAAAQGAISGKYLVRPGDVIYSKIRPYLQKAYKCDFDALCSADMYPLTPRRNADSSFILHTLLGHDFTNFAVSVSARSGIPKINREELAEYRMRVPSGAEQREIGLALDDADQLIDTLERLIAKKQAIKQGMMQQLLTGKTRLPGFTEPWREATVGGLTDQHRRTVDPRQDRERRFQHFSLPAFDDGEVPITEPGSAIDSIKFVVPAGSVLVSKLNPRIPRIWAPDGIGDNVIASTEFVVLTPRPGTDRSYLKWLMKSDAVVSRMKLLATGTTGSHARIHPRQVAALETRVPSEPEQVAIAALLDSADREVTLVRRRLTKARAIKQGMVQQLLTGRTRLPVNDEVAA
ncbi:restriction endonuclease subunit S [Ruania rhizosphaerae]|uniref:restriction endonuclease subunit S n=1 Tax=Ruania rhizosphaerae TaxID=1840413 RepID=UPI0023B27CF0|nr:restriction endonuclease subunit S [Ruania rhizosphaerae]